MQGWKLKLKQHYHEATWLSGFLGICSLIAVTIAFSNLVCLLYSNTYKTKFFLTRSGSVVDLAGFLESTYTSRCIHFLSRMAVLQKNVFFFISSKKGNAAVERLFKSSFWHFMRNTFWNCPIIYKHITPVDSLTSKSTMIETGFSFKCLLVTSTKLM